MTIALSTPPEDDRRVFYEWFAGVRCKVVESRGWVTVELPSGEWHAFAGASVKWHEIVEKMEGYIKEYKAAGGR